MPASPEEISATTSPAAAALQGLPAALDFVRHAGSDQLLAAGQIGDRFQVGRIADDDPAFGNRLDRPKRAVLPAAGTYSNDIQLSRAIATVTPWSICLGSINCVLLPAKQGRGLRDRRQVHLFLNEVGMLECPDRVPDFFRRHQPQRQAQFPGRLRKPARRP